MMMREVVLLVASDKQFYNQIYRINLSKAFKINTVHRQICLCDTDTDVYKSASESIKHG